jgi:multiple sugar transport system substrate-binding protein
MLDRQVQDDLIPRHHGQPALSSAWADPANNKRFNGFYSATVGSLETAWVRPRRAGYPAFQREAGRLVADALKVGTDGRDVAARVMELAARL